MKLIFTRLFLLKKERTTTRLTVFTNLLPLAIVKGKAHKQYKFGNKIGIITTLNTLIITAVKSFTGNPHDSKTIEPLLEQMQSNLNHTSKEIIYDRGGKGRKQIGDIHTFKTT